MNLVMAVLLALMLILPFLITRHGLPVPSFHSEWAAILLGMAAMLLWSFRVDLRRLHFPMAILPFLGLAAVIAIQYWIGMIPYAEQMALPIFYLVWAAGLVIVGRDLRARFDLQFLCALFAWALVAGGAMNSLIGLFQVFGNVLRVPSFLMDPLVASAAGRAYGNLGQANHFAAYLAVSLASIAYLHFSRRMPPPAALGLTALVLMGAILSGSRAFWGYLLALAAIGGLMIPSEARGSVRRVALGALGAIALLGLAVYLMPASLPEGVTRIVSLDELFSGRFHLLRHAWLMFLDAPLLGVGFGGFAAGMYQQSLVVSLTEKYGLDVNAHNLLFHLLAETGLCGLLVVLVPLLPWLRAVIKEERSLEKWWTAGVLSIVLLHGLIEYPLWYAYFTGLAALFMGMLSPGVAHFGRTGWLGSMPLFPNEKVLRAVMVLAILYAGAEAFQYARDYAYVEAAIYQPTVRKLDPGAREQGLRAVYGRGRLRRFIELAEPGVAVAASGNVAEKLELSRRVMRFSPVAEVAYRHSVLLASAGFRDDALDNLRKAKTLYPDRLGVYGGRMTLLARRDPETYQALADMLNK